MLPRTLLMAMLLASTLACQDRTTPRNDPVITGVIGDAGIVQGDVAFDEPVRALCVPGSRSCLAENSPLFDRCSPDGKSFARGSCDEGEVCREGACVPFTCVEGRALCVGATTSAVCDSTGKAVRDVTACEDASVCRGGACVDPCEDARAARSYIACDYVAQPLPNLYEREAGTSDSPFAIVLANPARLVDATVTVTGPSDEPAPLREPFDLVPDGNFAFTETTSLRSEILFDDGTSRPIESAENVQVPPGAAAVLLLEEASTFRVRSTRPVVAYQFSPYCCNFTATNDASLLLPTSTWGQRYRVLGYPSWRPANLSYFERAYFSIVADEASTVTVESPVPLRPVGTGVASTSFEYELAAGESVILEAALDEEAELDDRDADPTGALIESDQPVGVFTGHPCTFVPHDQWACDHLEEALLPVETWGQRYVLNPLRRRASGDRPVREGTYWRIVTDRPTTLTFDPPLEEMSVLAPSNESSPDCAALTRDGALELQAGEFCEFGTRDPLSLASTAPVMVGGVLSGHQSTGVSVYGTQAGDPSLFILPPVEQFREDYAFVTPPTFKRTYVTVAARPSSPVTIDGRGIAQEDRLERRTVELAGDTWEIFTIAIEPGVHTMASDTRFGIVVYAYDDYVSYAFIGGLDLLPKGAGPR